jgi:hypothetical protein
MATILAALAYRVCDPLAARERRKGIQSACYRFLLAGCLGIFRREFSLKLLCVVVLSLAILFVFAGNASADTMAYQNPYGGWGFATPQQAANDALARAFPPRHDCLGDRPRHHKSKPLYLFPNLSRSRPLFLCAAILRFSWSLS